jgi:hypothetical protein
MGRGKDEGGMMNASRELGYGEDFTGETVRVVKEKEVRLYGEYRMRRLVLESRDILEG